MLRETTPIAGGARSRYPFQYPTQAELDQMEAEHRRSRLRTFESGATRDTDANKPDYEGYLSPLVWERFGQYMTAHRFQTDGKVRASDNWAKGIPLDVYIKSAFRHFMAWWLTHDGYIRKEDIEESLCALLFNVQGYLHEHLKAQNEILP